jgi:hypothetical protein
LSRRVGRPLDCRAERPLARIGVAVAGEQVEALGQALEDLVRREDLRSGCGQLDRKRHLVEGAAELTDDVLVRFHPQSGSLAEELDRVGLGERPHLELNLAADADSLPARREDREVQAGLD